MFAGKGTKSRLLSELAAIECEVPAGCAGCPVVGVVTAATLYVGNRCVSSPLLASTTPAGVEPFPVKGRSGLPLPVA